MISTTSSRSRQDLLFVIFASFGSILNVLLGLFFGLAALSTIVTGVDASLPPPTWWAIAFGFLAMCGIPSTVYGARVLLNREDGPQSVKRSSYLVAVPTFLSGLLIGYLAFTRGIFPTILGPLAKIVAASSAALFVIQMARRFGPDLSHRRIWGQFILGLWVVPFLALVSEFLVLIPTLFLFGLGALTSENGRSLLALLTGSSSPSMDTLVDAANGILLEPWFIAIVLGFFAVLVPLIEEALKTLVVWPWLIRRRNSAEAFIGGVIGGTGYALFEAIFLTQAAPAWLPTMVGRAGATIMHAFTTGVASWGLSEGILNKRWIRMVLSYLVAVTFHGLWNAGALSIALIEVKAIQAGDLATTLEIVQSFLPIMIFGLAVTAFYGLNRLPRRFHSPIDEEASGEIPQEVA
jgi:hypothetical protein